MATGTALTGNSNVVMNLSNQNAVDLGTILDPLNINTGIAWTYGEDVNQVDTVFHDSRSAVDAGETLHLHTGAVDAAPNLLKDAFGNVITFDCIKLLYIKNNSTSLTLNILGTATTAVLICANPLDIIELQPGGILFLTCPTAAGIDVSTDEDDLLLAVKGGSGTINYDIVILGCDDMS